MVIALGCDHAGFPLKKRIVDALEKRHIEVADYGCYNGETVDFPDIARKVCTSVTQGDAERGIMLCGSGVGAAIACNKVPGIRAACCHDIYTAHQCVEHDDVNVIALGADVVGGQAACDLFTDIWIPGSTAVRNLREESASWIRWMQKNRKETNRIVKGGCR